MAATVTFNRDIAPILYKNCVTCHRPGESAPFSLISYYDVRDHAAQIAEVTHTGYMPPWLPEPGYGEFADERRLKPSEIALIAKWVEEGAVQGDPRHLPAPPKFTEGWQLGRPDAMVEMPESFTVPAEGRDIYRNFVIPMGFKEPRYIQAMEMRFDNPRVVHHAFTLFDNTDSSRELDLEDTLPGFDGMVASDNVFGPPGQNISWQPGKLPYEGSPDMSWKIEPGTDIVLQVHMQPTGKPETLRGRIGIHYSPHPPTKYPFKMMLRRIDIDIPAGESDHVVEDSYRLPVDVRVLSVLPHAHYLGKSVEAYAMLPTGEKKWLLKIDDWDFNWQGDYRLARPMTLRAGTTLHMRWTYDNSAANPRNPFNPPQDVSYGVQTVDEMGELWLQVLPRTVKDRQVLYDEHLVKMFNEVVTGTKRELAKSPDDFIAARRRYQALIMLGRDDEAVPAVENALRLRPNSATTNLEAGYLYFRQDRHADAQRMLLRAIALDSRQPKPHYLMGLSLLSTGQTSLGVLQLQTAVELNPKNVDARNELGKALLGQGQRKAAAQQFYAALRLAPNRQDIRDNLAAAQQ